MDILGKAIAGYVVGKVVGELTGADEKESDGLANTGAVVGAVESMFGDND